MIAAVAKSDGWYELFIRINYEGGGYHGKHFWVSPDLASVDCHPNHVNIDGDYARDENVPNEVLETMHEEVLAWCEEKKGRM